MIIGLLYSVNNVISIIQSDLVYPISLVSIKMFTDCETCGLLNHYKQKMILEVTRNCVRIVRDTD